MDEDRPEWDAALADLLIGKVVIIGVTYVDAKGELLRRVQMHGIVGRTDPREGVRIDLAGAKAGQVYWLPPQVSNFYPAQSGVYRLRETDEEVLDPDFLSTWTIQAPETVEDLA